MDQNKCVYFGSIEPWKEWTTCDVPCGGGTRFRTREVLNYARYGGEICQGDAKEVEACNQQPCPSK